ncbi:Uncharacterised protein [Salmonella enterica subsp. enterica serovar Bovismorbificans]|uniref:Uncharacterized protein n=1 Tax=Salmonella enterica subsp. enterica serovar Bovismorbificans TaxID=58097 RepID=A0A655BKZ3_SALET|nr:Uncharacterised protein [Salmonella enterica subsp. enterica serovar Bovismorbificans]CNT74420.1 Uncharacterised protein [Salmonella enterica subsp. enterica serovar Bovismorbificans]
MFQPLLFSSLLLLQLLCLLLLQLFTLVFRASGAGLLILLTVVLLHNGARIDHHRVDSGTAAAAGRSLYMLIKRTPDQHCK